MDKISHLLSVRVNEKDCIDYVEIADISCPVILSALFTQHIDVFADLRLPINRFRIEVWSKNHCLQSVNICIDQNFNGVSDIVEFYTKLAEKIINLIKE